MHSHLSDIDELVLLCRDDESRKYIAEAVASYKVGAFRACIVMTWIAVQFDFIDKLRILADRGNTQARDYLEEFEKARKIAQESNKYYKAQEFERNVLVYARDQFEFITASECEELERLQRDRNKCAHPHMVTLDEPYQPTAELARYHLKNAVVYFLQYPPTHGKSLISDLIEYTKEERFPEKLDLVIDDFRSKHLHRTKSSAIRSLVLAMIKGLLHDETFDGKQFRRTSNALNALRRIQRETCEKTIEKHLSEIAIKLNDIQLVQLFKFLHTIDDTYQYLRADARIRVTNFLLTSKNMEQLILGMVLSLDIYSLRNVVFERLNTPDDSTLEILIHLCVQTEGRQELFKPSINYAKYVNNSAQAERIFKDIFNYYLDNSWIEPTHIEQIIAECENNEFLMMSEGFKDFIHVCNQRDYFINKILIDYPKCEIRYKRILDDLLPL